MLKKIIEEIQPEVNENSKKLKKIVANIQQLLMDALTESDKLDLDLPFDEINDWVGDIGGNIK